MPRRQPTTAARVALVARVAAQGDVDISSAPAAGAAVWDGETLVADNLVMLPRQTDTTENGLYVWPGAGLLMLRAAKMRSGRQLFDGLEVKVGEGTVDKDTVWTLTTDLPVGGYDLGTTALAWQRTTAAGGGGGGAPATVKVITFADSPYAQLDTDQTLVADCTDGPITISLLAIASATGDLLVEKTDDTGNDITLDADGVETLRGAGTFVWGGQWMTTKLRPSPAQGRWIIQ